MARRKTVEQLRGEATTARVNGNELYDEADGIRDKGRKAAQKLRRQADSAFNKAAQAKKPATVNKYETQGRKLSREADKTENAADKAADKLEAKGQKLIDKSHTLDNKADALEADNSAFRVGDGYDDIDADGPEDFADDEDDGWTGNGDGAEADDLGDDCGFC